MENPSNPEVELVEKVANLTIELQVAKESIQDLQHKLECRESELRTSNEKHERSFRRRTRQRKTSGLLNGSFKSERNNSDVQSLEGPLNGCLMLTICGYSRERTSHHDLFHQKNSNDTFSNSPTLIHMLEGKMYVVGPNGATIGSGSGCGVKVPSETGIRNYHGCIKGQINLTNGKTDFFFYKLVPEKYKQFVEAPKVIASTEMQLQNGSVFLTGNIKWKVSLVPMQYYLFSNAFIAVRTRSKKYFIDYLKEIVNWNGNVMKQASEVSNEEEKENILQKQILLSSEENLNYALCTDLYDEERKEDNLLTNQNNKDQFSLLHVAVDYGNVDIVNILLKRSISVNMQCGNQKYTPLHLACKNDNMELVKLLLQFGAYVDIKDNNSDVPLNVTESFRIRKILLLASLFSSACGEGDVDNVQRVFHEEPICVDVRGFRHYTPLHLASFYGHEDVVKFLLEKNASPNLADYQYRRTALHFAVLSDNVEIAKLLLQYCVNPLLTDVFGYTAINLCQSKEMLEILQEDHQDILLFNMAVQIGNQGLIQRLLEDNQKENIPNSLPNHIADKLNSTQRVRKTSRQIAMNNIGVCALVDQKDARGLRPMHIAAAAGNMDILQILYNHGGSVNNTGGIEMWSPLFFSSLCGQHECIEYLLSLGADSDQIDTHGHHCIDLVEKEINFLKVKLKIEGFSSSISGVSGVDSMDAGKQSIIPPQYLLSKENPCIDLMCESCLRIRLKRLTRVLHSLQSNQQKLLILLQDENEDGLHRLLDEKDINLNTPLSKSLPITPLNYAASLGLEKITEILLTYNACPYFSDNQSYMPIHTAAECGYEQVIRVLIQDGIDVNVQTDIQKFTALHIAASKNETSVVSYLMSVEDIDISLLDKNNKKPFDLATNPDIQYMLAVGEELLYLAVYYDDSRKLNAFFDTGVFNVNEIWFEDISLLHVAAIRNHEDVARILIENNAHINAITSYSKETPIHCACRNSSALVVELLLKNGAELTMEDINGRTPFEVTVTNDIRKLILLHTQAGMTQKEEKTDTEHVTSPISMVTSEDEDDGKCRICLTNMVNTIVLPCAHQAFCSECVLKIDTCSLDRGKIQNIIFTNTHPHS